MGIYMYIASFILKSETVSAHLNMKGCVYVCLLMEILFFLEIICSGSVECISLLFVGTFSPSPLSVGSFTPSEKFGKVEMKQRCRGDKSSISRGY